MLPNLADADDYITVRQALEEYADAQDFEVRGVIERIEYNNLPASESDANGRARRAVGKAGGVRQWE